MNQAIQNHQLLVQFKLYCEEVQRRITYILKIFEKKVGLVKFKFIIEIYQNTFYVWELPFN